MTVTRLVTVERLPNNNRLRNGLLAVLNERDMQSRDVAILDRRVNIYTSTFPSEIVTCRIRGGSTVRFFIKYSAESGNQAYGHRGGIGYEAKVYSELLRGLNVSTAKYYGFYLGPDGREIWLVLDYLHGCTRVTKTLEVDAMAKAARWLGQYHALCCKRITDPALSFITRYNAEYYRGWMNRTRQMAIQVGADSRWLKVTCDHFEKAIGVLCEAPQTVIHGEYYPKNILLQQGRIYPVDWESAAIGCGEIDLAMLVDKWRPEMIQELGREYQRARWPEGVPSRFVRRLKIARIYVQFRWLGDQQTPLAEWSEYLEGLRHQATEMGLI